MKLELHFRCVIAVTHKDNYSKGIRKLVRKKRNSTFLLLGKLFQVSDRIIFRIVHKGSSDVNVR
jgi:hypothetical protein